jgi:hypothetical protein
MKKGTSTEAINRHAAQGGEPLAVEVVFRSLPFRSYGELRGAIGDKRYGFGVDPLAAAEWSSQANTDLNRAMITALSVLLVLAGAASVIAAFVVNNYWLLLALPIQALAFYGAHLDAPYRMWVTIAGVASLFIFLDLLFNQMPTAATLTAYAGLTFSAVRATSAITNSAFRKALAVDEQLFLDAYTNRACTVRDNKTKQIYEYDVESR